jgi:hypothetical protein
MKMLNVIGVIVLVVGLSGAVLLYRQDRPMASHSDGEWKDGSLSLTDSKTNTRNIEMYGGKLEVFMVKCVEWLKRSESQAIVVAAISVLVAFACFFAAAMLSRRHSMNTGK